MYNGVPTITATLDIIYISSPRTIMIACFSRPLLSLSPLTQRREREESRDAAAALWEEQKKRRESSGKQRGERGGERGNIFY